MMQQPDIIGANTKGISFNEDQKWDDKKKVMVVTRTQVFEVQAAGVAEMENRLNQTIKAGKESETMKSNMKHCIKEAKAHIKSVMESAEKPSDILKQPEGEEGKENGSAA